MTKTVLKDCTQWVGPGLGDRMPSLIVDRGPKLPALGWALTRMHDIPLLLQCSREER